MLERYAEIGSELLLALGQTFLMVSLSLLVGLVLGGLLGLLLFTSSQALFTPRPLVLKAAGTLINAVRSIPFLIFMIFLLPLSKLIVGSKIGSAAAIVPLAISAIAFFARLAEAAFSSVSYGVLEASFACGASKQMIIRKVLLPEARLALIKNTTVTAISILGFSSMAGLIGGGGLGDLAYRYGYQRYQVDIMILCIVLLLLLVQVVQWLGDLCIKKYSI